ncbi:MAG TPA: hypothetical protein VNC50_12125 [Planctomycetia bacterium]|nr:hypothetical protein [Planctomycetia bacterium]
MGHHIFGFIAPTDELEVAASELPGARTASLADGFAFLPLSGPFHDEEDPAAHAATIKLTTPLVEWAARQSNRFPIAYIETDYFGGRGVQAAIVWSKGTVIFGAAATPDFTSFEKPRPPQAGGAINQALRRLGVARRPSLDEFDTLGLGRHRDNAAWRGE